MDSPASPPSDAALKRKRDDASPTADASAPAPKSSRTGAGGGSLLSINYLARQSQDDLPLVNKDDALPVLLQLLASYGSILDRHESLASNLGARPLGPILIKRFERCFDSPPKVVASHHKTSAANAAATSAGAAEEQQITWLEVIEFARSHPSQFTLSTFSEGKRVCQFYYPQKQLRVQISEEDFLFINSGRCQELIPPLPIWEDEETEVETCDVLELKLKELTNVADMVAARTRQLSHRLKGRRAAILERRAEGGYGTPAKASAIQTTPAPPTSSPASGFTAVNTGKAGPERHGPPISSSANPRGDLLRQLESLPQNQSHIRSQLRRLSTSMADAQPRHTDLANGGVNSSSHSPAPATGLEQSARYTTESASGQRPSTTAAGPHTPGHASSLASTLKHNFSRPLAPAQEERQPFRPLCQAHMDALPRGQRVLPPCDRCRRLRMDCVKNLTSCAGCTKKHARCHWRDVERDELTALDGFMDAEMALGSAPRRSEHATGESEDDLDDEDDDDDDSNPLEDLEALGEKEEREVAARLRADNSEPADAVDGAAAVKPDPADDQPTVSDTVNGTAPPIIASIDGVLSPSAASDRVDEPGLPSAPSAPAPATSAEAPPAKVDNTALAAPPAVQETATEPPAAATVPFDIAAPQRPGGFRAVNDSAATDAPAGFAPSSAAAWQTV